MYKLTLTLAVALTIIVGAIVTSPKANAQTLDSKSSINEILNLTYDLDKEAPLVAPFKIAKPEQVTTPEPPKPKEYIVVEGDSLTKIAESQNTTIQSLWTKNTQLANQNELKVGDKLLIPLPTDVLEPRPFITPPVPVEAPKTAQISSKRTYIATTSGNTYSPGYCTFYVKHRRPDMPNSLGNANTWYARASALGMSVGSTPQAGAVGTTTRGSSGHVVIVESVNGNGTITISEMNREGWNVISSRTASANEFLYIY